MNAIKHGVTDLTARAAEAATEMQEGAKGAWNAVQNRTRDAACAGGIYAHRHPLPVALVAFGCGLAVGTWLALQARGDRH